MVTAQKVSSEQQAFVLLAIDTLKGEGKEGIHTVFSGFNEAFRAHFAGVDPVKVVDLLVKQGVLEGHPSKKGYTMYPKGKMPTQASKKGEIALAMITARM